MLRHIPNLLCLVRLALTPVCVAAILQGNSRAALALFTTAGLTDFFDGFLARRMHWNSPLGALLDPAADKFLMAGVYIALGWTHSVPPWLVALIFGRDFLIIAGAFLIYRARGIRKFAPTMTGKVSTAIQISAAVAVLCVDADIVPAWWRPLAIVATTAGTACSLIDYTRIGWRMMNQEAQPK